MEELKKLRIGMANQLLDLRAMEYLVLSDRFAEAWANANEADKAQVNLFLKDGKQNKVKEWMKNLVLESCSIKELRTKAFKLGCDNYSRYSKEELITLIRETQYDREHSRRSDANHHVDSDGRGRNAKDAGEARIPARSHNLQAKDS